MGGGQGLAHCAAHADELALESEQSQQSSPEAEDEYAKKQGDAIQAEKKCQHNAEKQVLEALPKMEDQASSRVLKEAFRMHRAQTEKQVDRLDRIFRDVGNSPGGVTCAGVQGIIAEGETQAMLQKGERDADFIAALPNVLAAVPELGGSVTGEHGIGVEKIDQMPLLFSPQDLLVMSQLRRVFDPGVLERLALIALGIPAYLYWNRKRAGLASGPRG